MHHMEHSNSHLFSPNKSPPGAMLMDMLYVTLTRTKNTRNSTKSRRRRAASASSRLSSKTSSPNCETKTNPRPPNSKKITFPN